MRKSDSNDLNCNLLSSYILFDPSCEYPNSSQPNLDRIFCRRLRLVLESLTGCVSGYTKTEVRLADRYSTTLSSGSSKNSKSSKLSTPGRDCVGTVACKYESVNSTICILGSTDPTAAAKDFQAFCGSDVSVK